MVIDDFDIPGRPVAPGEADAELVVDADAPLPNANNDWPESFSSLFCGGTRKDSMRVAAYSI
ncbi:MAG: hypothetical protein A3H33_14215 [Betaproteobacteria bacterium RIFCSPLOWO2_02_FULL_65_20]|nr:MAG: hypothetical protein A3H33_14215 [Betaproteobacteria bacterium RIFCSPLOWO2_02_FULL_65_20]